MDGVRNPGVRIIFSVQSIGGMDHQERKEKKMSWDKNGPEIAIDGLRRGSSSPG